MSEPHHGSIPPPDPACRLTVVIPARNEAALLGQALAALSRQRDLDGQPLAPNSFDIIVFANNCSDATAAVARACATAAPGVPIAVVEHELAARDAHIGAARRFVMDIAAARFFAAGQPDGIIASTDSDTVVDDAWIAWTLREARGADAVAGYVAIGEADQQRLLAPVRLLYARELTYRRLIAEVEALIDPQPEDPLPRHSAFVGASFAVNARTYVRAGMLPPLPRLEDQQFCRALRRVDARIRHSPFVRATTSPRVSARVDGGFGTFIARLHDHAARGESFKVEHPRQTLAVLAARAALRRVWSGTSRPADSALHARLQSADVDGHARRPGVATFGSFYERAAAVTATPLFPDVSVDYAIETLRAAAQRLAPAHALPDAVAASTG